MTDTEKKSGKGEGTLEEKSVFSGKRKRFLFHSLLCLFLAIPLLFWYGWEEVEIHWSLFLLRSHKAEVGDKARDFLVRHHQGERLREALRHSNLNVRRQASFAMHLLAKDPETSRAIPFLMEVARAKDTDIKVRWHSLRALGYLQSKEAVPLLIEVLEGADELCPNPSCRNFHLWEEAHQALQRIYHLQVPFEPVQNPHQHQEMAHYWKQRGSPP